ncbi:SMI1/KNR4 family protein [Streptomyces sp. NBC_01334]|uniref:SMI1/KNR4 family protein n=1 Tax=Streptomyces sp. NBC_01334 TaxID=2903827 RepID=UPI002E0E510D|nr:SMI1/KNR4 family protein [Streptomyces sp. NBC_01334]
MTQNIELLARLMPPHPGAGDVVDWGLLEQSWGTRFPGDYKEFIARYGAGAISDYVVIFSPECRAEDGAEPAFQGMEEETLNAQQLWSAKGPGGAGSDRVIAWGLDSSADILCWRITGDDPDGWPVVVWNQDDVVWQEYPCGVVEFLHRVLDAEFDECPLGGLTLWGNAAPRFLHRDEEQRLRASGLDPWTGEPDPYAGMFGD